MDVAALVKYYRPLVRGPIVIACGSMSAFVCWRLVKNADAAKTIDAYVVLGGFPDPQFLSSGTITVSPIKTSHLFRAWEHRFLHISGIILIVITSSYVPHLKTIQYAMLCLIQANTAHRFE